MAVGFEFAETMTGTFERLDDASGGPASGHLRFDIKVAAPSVWDHLRDRKCRLWGLLDMDGLASGATVEGEMLLAPLFRRRIGYDFTFAGDDGNLYRFTGKKDIKFSALRHSLTTLPATVTDASGRPVARCDVRFDIDADLPAFLASWRPS